MGKKYVIEKEKIPLLLERLAFVFNSGIKLVLDDSIIEELES